MFDRQAASKHLDKNLSELSGREVVEERVKDGAEVEEGVCDRVENDVDVEIRDSPARFGNGGHHEATDLVGEPADHQGADNKTKKNDSLLPGHLNFGTFMFGCHIAPIGLSVHGQRSSQNHDHGSAHESHTDEYYHVNEERYEDTNSVHQPVLPQIGAKCQILNWGVLANGNVALGSSGDQ